MFSLIMCIILWFFGLGICFTCCAFIPVLAYRSSEDPVARKYGNYGLVGMIVSAVINIVLLFLVALPIAIGLGIASSVN